MTKIKPMILLILIIGCLFCGWNYFKDAPLSYESARKQVEGFIAGVNGNEPDKIYTYLTPEIKRIIDSEGFVKNFTKERSYPYLTPLYLYLDKLELSEDKKTGHVICVVAARLPGEKMEFAIKYVNGNYYIDGFKDIADGSYIKKFDKLSPALLQINS